MEGVKEIPGWEGKYGITKNGKVWSFLSNKWLSIRINTKGYYVTQFSKKVIPIHRLVALTYIPNPENKPTVDHINRNRLDNRIENLRWATIEEQNENRDMKKIRQSALKGSQNAIKVNSRPIEMRDKINHNILYKTFSSSYQAAIQEFGDAQKNSLINRCARGKKQSAYGYYWCYAK